MKTQLGVVDYMAYQQPIFTDHSNKDWVSLVRHVVPAVLR